MSDPEHDRQDETQPIRNERRHSSVKQITRPNKGNATLVLRALRLLSEVKRTVSTETNDEAIARAHVHLLERLCPGVDFAVLVSADALDRSTPLRHATRPLADPEAAQIALSEAALVFSSIESTTAFSPTVTITEGYQTRLRQLPTHASLSHGLDVPLRRGGAIIGALAAESSSGHLLTPELRTALLTVADHLVAALDHALLRRETHHLRDYVEKLLQHANVPVIIAGADRSVRVVSEAFLRIAGLRRRDVIDSDVLALAPPTDRVRLLATFASATRGRAVDPIELQIQQPSGQLARVELRLAPIVDAQGAPAGVIGIGRDLTEVRALEGQVLHAGKLATIGQLATGIVHEINNPLTSIGTYSEYVLGRLRELGADNADIERAERIVQGADRIKSFTKNLVTYARPSDESPEEVDVLKVLEESVSFCEHIIDEANAIVVRDFAPHIPSISAVPGRLQQVFVNLITNACHAAPEHNARLEIGARYLDDGRVSIWVRDNGQGIDPDKLERIFDPFFSTKGMGQGTGLGLSIVRNIVEQHGGQIEVNSAIGAGTSFTLTFPSLFS